MKNTLSKILVGAVALLALSQSANASGAGGFYVVPKAIVIFGDDIEHHHHNYEGDSGKGIGIDIGYAFTSNLALEVALTYAEADITEPGHGTGDAEFTTYGVVGVYSRTIIGHLRGFAKFGYAYEYEEITGVDHEFKGTVSGTVYALGVEYGFADNMEVVFEVERSEVVSTRGKSAMLGLKYIF